MSGRIFILIFHGVGDPPRRLQAGEEKVWVSRHSLCSVLDAAARRGDVRLTFDDGNESDYEVALPELCKRGLQATFFVVAARIGQPGFLDREMIRELRGAGMRVQSHGMRHRQWRRLDRSSLHEELITARGVIEEVISDKIDEVAIPYCLYDRRVLKALRSAGYRRVYTCDRGPAAPGAWLQPRNQISNGEDARKLAQIVSPSFAARLELALKAPVKRWRW